LSSGEIMETRLREVENEQSEFRAKIERIIDDITTIREFIEKVSLASARSEHFDRIDTKVEALHRRLDKLEKDLWQMQVEHIACTKSREADSILLYGLKDTMTDLKRSVDILYASAQRKETFWQSRIGTLIDKAIWILFGILIVLILLHYGELNKASVIKGQTNTLIFTV
jgi:DNA repair exonuclease SbcCD ATPase subunit